MSSGSSAAKMMHAAQCVADGRMISVRIFVKCRSAARIVVRPHLRSPLVRIPPSPDRLVEADAHEREAAVVRRVASTGNRLGESPTSARRAAAATSASEHRHQQRRRDAALTAVLRAGLRLQLEQQLLRLLERRRVSERAQHLAPRACASPAASGAAPAGRAPRPCRPDRARRRARRSRTAPCVDHRAAVQSSASLTCSSASYGEI